MATSYAEDDSFTVYDTHGRQKNYSESVVQRKERIEFLKQREWVRRVTEWVRQTNAQKDLVRKTFFTPYRHSYFKKSILGRSARSHFPLPYHDPGLTSAIPFPCVEEEEEEPYIIYSSSPSSSLSSLSEEITPVLPLISGPSPSIGLPVAAIPQRRASGHHRRCSSASLRGHTRKQSLSSIYEVPEED